MAWGEIEIGDAIACVDRATGHTGVLHVETDKVWAEFVGFGTPPRVNADAPIYLHTAKGWVVSLHRNVDFGSEMPAWRKGEVSEIYHQRIVTNLAICGVTAWSEEDRAEFVAFRPERDCGFLWPADRAIEIAETQVGEAPDRRVFGIHVPGGSITLDLAYGRDPVRPKWTPTDPWLTVHFDEAAPPSECLHKIDYVTSLFCLLSWRDIQVEEIVLRQVGAPEKSPFHRILPVVPATLHRTMSKRPLAVSVDDEAERAAFAEVLRTWVERQEQWEESTGLMLAALRRVKSISAERALDACRWHEVIERATAKGDTAPLGMEEVKKAAVAKAREVGLGGYEEWIWSVLSGVKTERRKAQLQRLGRETKERFGYDFFDDAGVEMLLRAYAARQKTGHGTIGPLASDEVQLLWGGIVAMETLCALRTIADLPISDEGKGHLSMHPLIRDLKELRRREATDRVTRAGGRETGGNPTA